MLAEVNHTDPDSRLAGNSGTPSPQWSPPGVPIRPSPPTTERVKTVLEVATERLRASSYPALRNLRAELYERTLIIRGTVSSFYLKQVAQALLGDLVPKGLVARIENRVDVDKG